MQAREEWQDSVKLKHLKWAMQHKGKEPVEEPMEFGYNYPEEDVDQLCFYVISSGYTVFPKAGGLEDQDPLFIADLDTYRWLREWAEQEARTMGGEGGESKGLAFDEL